MFKTTNCFLCVAWLCLSSPASAHADESTSQAAIMTMDSSRFVRGMRLVYDNGVLEDLDLFRSAFDMKIELTRRNGARVADVSIPYGTASFDGVPQENGSRWDQRVLTIVFDKQSFCITWPDVKSEFGSDFINHAAFLHSEQARNRRQYNDIVSAEFANKVYDLSMFVEFNMHECASSVMYVKYVKE